MNTAAEIREATRTPDYPVVCDACHGKRYLDGRLCGKCEGNGRLLIRERRVSPPLSENGKFVVVCAAGLGFLVAALVTILM